jgi:hypothetical protein
VGLLAASLLSLFCFIFNIEEDGFYGAYWEAQHSAVMDSMYNI